MNKELKFGLLLGLVLVVLIIDQRIADSAAFVLFMMACLIPLAIIGFAIRVLKTEPPRPTKPFVEDQPDTWYEHEGYD